MFFSSWFSAWKQSRRPARKAITRSRFRRSLYYRLRLEELEPRLGFARQLFNDAAQAYNDAARQFPTRLLTHLFGFGTAGRL